jgi:hypothetical protein
MEIRIFRPVRKQSAPRGGGIRGGRERSLRVGGSAVVDLDGPEVTLELATGAHT